MVVSRRKIRIDNMQTTPSDDSPEQTVGPITGTGSVRAGMGDMLNDLGRRVRGRSPAIERSPNGCPRTLCRQQYQTQAVIYWA